MFNTTGYKEYGRDGANRKWWIKNWREVLYWKAYFDYQIFNIENDVLRYCNTNDIPVSIDGGWIYCISDRRQYKDIMNIIYGILGEEEEE